MVSSPEKNVLEFGFLPGQKVADMGSGAGHYTIPLSRALGSEGEVYAIDKNEPALIRLKNLVQSESRGNVEIILGDIGEDKGTHLRNGLVDGVVFSNIFLRLDDKKGALLEAWRILKPGGKMCIVEWSDEAPFSVSHNKTKKNLITKAKVEETLKSIGFVALREFDAGEHHYGLIYLKPAIHTDKA